jgi:EpsI family protein
VTRRLFVLTGILLFGAAANRSVRIEDRVPPREPLRAFPMQIADWAGERGPDFQPRVVEILGTDEYITRIYRRDLVQPVDFYVGYYESQRTGRLIHSPLNCLPGAGWQPIESEQISIHVPASATAALAQRDVSVNRLVVQKGEERQVVFYWYQGRGRVTASEYAGRLFMAIDALRRHRTDGALVRVMSPMTDGLAGATSPDVAIRIFVQAVFPVIERYVPS